MVAGDVFDHWNAPVELVNALIAAVRAEPNGQRVYCIPGQHDLPNHRYEDARRSAYWTLVEACEWIDLRPHELRPIGDRLAVQGFPWGADLAPLATCLPNRVHLAVVHAYCWRAGACHPGAAPEAEAAQIEKRLAGFDAVLVGDNHHPFQEGKIYNHGLFVRRRTDERQLVPSMGILWDDGRVTTRPLDVSGDRFAAVEKADALAAAGADAAGLVDLLRAAGDEAISFADALRRRAAAEEDGVRTTLLGWLS